jgi:hypothetical protein
MRILRHFGQIHFSFLCGRWACTCIFEPQRGQTMAQILQYRAMAHYFAYDLDMDPARLIERCPGAKPLRKGKLPYYRPEFVQYGEAKPVLDLVPDEKKEVWGVLYFVPDPEVDRIDPGVEPGKVRRILPAWDPDNRAYAALVYTNPAEGMIALPDKEYHSKILNLVRLAELPDKYFDLINAVKPK